MDNSQINEEICQEDLRAALREMGSYIDVTADDLKAVYTIALRHARERLAVKTPVKDAMTTNVVTLAPDADIHEAVRLFMEHTISGVPVVDNENHVLGVITDTDLLHMAGVSRAHTFKDILKYIAGGTYCKHKSGNTVKDVMTAPAITVAPDMDIREAAGILDARRIRRLPVVDADNKLIGIISRGNIVRMMTL